MSNMFCFIQFIGKAFHQIKHYRSNTSHVLVISWPKCYICLRSIHLKLGSMSNKWYTFKFYTVWSHIRCYNTENNTMYKLIDNDALQEMCRFFGELYI